MLQQKRNLSTKTAKSVLKPPKMNCAPKVGHKQKVNEKE